MIHEMPNITIASVKQASSCLSLGDDLALIDNVKSVILPDEAKRLGCFIFAFCDKGSVTYEIDTMPQKVEAGHCIIMCAGQVLQKVELSADCQGRMVFLSPQYAQEVLTGMHNLSFLPPTPRLQYGPGRGAQHSRILSAYPPEDQRGIAPFPQRHGEGAASGVSLRCRQYLLESIQQ